MGILTSVKNGAVKSAKVTCGCCLGATAVGGIALIVGTMAVKACRSEKQSSYEPRPAYEQPITRHTPPSTSEYSVRYQNPSEPYVFQRN